MFKIGRFEASFAIEKRANAYLYPRRFSFTLGAGELICQGGTASLVVSW